MKWLSKQPDLQCFVLNQANISNFHPVEVVDRGSETQLQLGENNTITYYMR